MRGANSFLSVCLMVWVCAGCGGDDETQLPVGDSSPFATTSNPVEGAADVDAATIDSIDITFSELMDTTAGNLVLSGAGTLGTPAWSGQTLTVPVTDLAGDTAYKVTLEGFVDAAGVALDGVPYLQDGILDFSTTGGGPKAISSDPNEGQLDVAVDLAAIAVTFDRPMDTTITQATLEGGTSPVALSGAWDGAAATVTFSLADPLEHGVAYRVDLTGYRDDAGTALDGTPYLEDGALDFVSIQNPDLQAPFAVSSDPVEGTFNLDPELLVATLTFSEAMDETITDVPFAEGTASPQMVGGTWSDGGTVFTVNFAGYLTSGQAFHLDVTGFRDLAGNLLDATHDYLVDGILDFALSLPTGESCVSPLTKAQATLNAGVYTWTIAAAAVSAADGQFDCDTNNSGHDAVIKFTKLSDTVDNGGNLLHVNATGLNDDIDLEITSGYCATGEVQKCLWLKRSWGTFLDVPAGPYWIFVADDDTAGGFPGATVTVEEIAPTAPQAEGEGCFAPYTTSSAIYTPPATSDDPHVWTIPGTINGYDISNATGAVGSLSCDLSHGVDAVIEFQKTLSSSSLTIEVDNLDPTLTQSALDVEVLSGCDPLESATQSYFCGSNLDNFAFTAAPPAGVVYVWVATEGTIQDFNGAEVRITEFSPGIGETFTNPEPLTASGPINPTSNVGVDRPSCFPLTSNVHWYSYTTTGTLFGVQGDAVAALAVLDISGNEIACSTNTTTVAIGSRVTAGETILIAVESPTAIVNLNLIDQTYSGVVGSVTNLGITFPTTAVNEYSMAVGTNEIFLGYFSEIWSFPKTGSATAVEHNTTEGLGTAQLGYDITFAAGKLFSVDNTTTATTSRLFAVYDEPSNVWGPTTWDVAPNYPASTPFYAMTSDGTNIIMAHRATTASGGVVFYTVPVSAPAPAVQLGTNTTVHYAVGLAADASYFYVVGRDTALVEGLYRIDRANIAAPAVRLAPVDVNLTRTNVMVDDLAAASHIYVRDDVNVLHAVANVGTTPIYLGGLLTNGGTADWAMGIDRSTNTIYMFDSTLASTGGIVAVQ